MLKKNSPPKEDDDNAAIDFIEEDERTKTHGSVVFRTSTPVLFSPIRQGTIKSHWDSWKPRDLFLHKDGVLIYCSEKNSSRIKGQYKLDKVKITELAGSSAEHSEDLPPENGMVVKCSQLDGMDTYFRCVMNDGDLQRFKTAVKEVASEHNVDLISSDMLGKHLKKNQGGGGGGFLSRKKKGVNASAMRRAVAQALDAYDVRSAKEKVLSRRGALKWLPVFFQNDLVHGSWYD